MKRREFMSMLAGVTAAWPLAVRAQQPGIPVIGFLNGLSPEVWAPFVNAFRRGLSEGGYDEGRNVVIEYRWAENHNERLAGMVAELVRRPVAVIVASGGDQAVQVAKAATTTIPIVSTIAFDPVESGLVASMNRPGGNVTGISLFSTALVAKRIELLRDLAPNASIVGFLANPADPSAKTDEQTAEAAARALGQSVVVVNVATLSDCEAAFDSLVSKGAGALLIQSNPFFNSIATQIVALARRHSLAAIYGRREFVAAGGLISYGSQLQSSYRQLGDYTARILKGAKAAELPVLQPTAFELIVNLKVAKEMGIMVPTSLLLRADEIIE
ncbi:MAG TPA: ABC transporter substrate-binding protein [Bradyrhizobium sp.]|nr:ABC transporter substrate-binding protein [Bradyrhizobium sp.]